MKQINWADHILNFLAVIIGVSLAFYISSSAEKNRKNLEVDAAKQSFIDELISDREVFVDYQIPGNEDQLEALQKIVEMSITGEVDSLDEKFDYLLDINNYAVSSTTFNSLASSGKLSLIRDFELRKAIASYHQGTAEEAEYLGTVQTDFFMLQLIPWISKNTSVIDLNPRETIKNTEFVNLVVIYGSLIKNKVEQYHLIVEKSIALEEALKESMNE